MTGPWAEQSSGPEGESHIQLEIWYWDYDGKKQEAEDSLQSNAQPPSNVQSWGDFFMGW